MHDALLISEIVSIIFSFTNQKSKASCAQVCKSWSENALDALWCKLDTPKGLFHIMGLRTYRDERGNTVLQENDLRRCCQNASRVRHLEFSYYDSTKYPDSSLAAYFYFRPFLTPNLTHLTWARDPDLLGESLRWCSLFLNHSLKSLHIVSGWNANETSVTKINAFLIVTSTRAPHLESLTLQCPLPYRAVGERLPILLASLRMLKFARLDDPMLSSDVVKTLGTLPNLEEVRIPHAYYYNTIEDETTEPDTILPLLGDGAFPSIKVLEFKVPLSTLHPFLKPPFPAAQLQRLRIRTPRAESPAQIHAFFRTLATECPHINRIKLSIHTTPAHTDFAPLPFSCLAPLLACRSLTALTLDAPSVLEFDDAQAASAASSWPQMQKLRLSAPAAFRPRNVTQPLRATFAALGAFAKHCPDLRDLDLSVHPSDIPPRGARTPFPHLEHLALGVGAAGYSRTELAAFVVEVTPAGSVVNGTAMVHLAEWHNVREHEERLEMTMAMVDAFRTQGDGGAEDTV